MHRPEAEREATTSGRDDRRWWRMKYSRRICTENFEPLEHRTLTVTAPPALFDSVPSVATLKGDVWVASSSSTTGRGIEDLYLGFNASPTVSGGTIAAGGPNSITASSFRHHNHNHEQTLISDPHSITASSFHHHNHNHEQTLISDPHSITASSLYHHNHNHKQTLISNPHSITASNAVMTLKKLSY
ncbi:hypothetical protein LguiA_006458 [Lonicera macranthoides]